ncbi:hypothetical protein GCM10019059_43500 [Camelimonas fluminis]|nr:hypothetical protein GCM10019059_43500 [Camelimonas fluminis]
MEALKANFGGVDLLPVKLPSDPWPWNGKPDHKLVASPSLTAESPLVSVVIPHFNLGDYLLPTIMSVLQQTYENIEIIIVDDASFDIESVSVIKDLANSNNDRLRILTAQGNVGLSGARNIGLSDARGKYLLPLDADDILNLRFIEIAVRALQNNPEYDIFVTPAAYFEDGENLVLPGEEADFPDYATFVGEALVSGVRQNKFSTATALFRAAVVKKYRYVESLFSYEDWNLYLRLAQDGHRFLVSNDVYFYYRNRANSMVKEAHDPERHSLFLHDNLRTAVRPERRLPLAHLASIAAASSRASPIGTHKRDWDGILDLLTASIARRTAERAKPRGIGLLFALKDRLQGRDKAARDQRLVSASDLFDAHWYLRTYPDVAAAKLNPANHYISHGANEGRDPGPFFSTRDYLAANPDVRNAGINPLVHYVTFGLQEGRNLGRRYG